MTQTEKMPNDISSVVRYAGFDKRLKAFGFDYLLICGYIFLLTIVTIAVIEISGYLGISLRWPENPILADLMAFVTLVLPVILYFTLQESSPQQATWGKRKAGLLVVSANGGRLPRKQAFVRSVVKMIPWQIGHTCLFQMLASPSISSWMIAGYVVLQVCEFGLTSTATRLANGKEDQNR